MRQFELEALCQSCPPLSSGLTLAGGHRVVEAPSAIGLTVDDPLASVVVARVTDENQLGLELVLRLEDEPPPAVFHADAADVRTCHSWGGTERRGGFTHSLWTTLARAQRWGLGDYNAVTMTLRTFSPQADVVYEWSELGGGCGKQLGWQICQIKKKNRGEVALCWFGLWMWDCKFQVVRSTFSKRS